MSRLLICLITLLCASSSALATEFDFSSYAGLLQRHLSIDRRINDIPVNTLDYAALDLEQKNESSEWRKLLTALKSFDPEALKERDARMAFWINVYNIAAIKTILDHWPVDSIRSRSIHWLGNPWKRDSILVGGRNYSLHEIEFDLLIEGFHDLRVHLGINCASTSCLDLIAEPYNAARLDAQLRRQGERLASQPDKGLRIDREAGVVHVSKIFAFDEDHFEAWAGGAVPFLLPYVTDPDARSYLETGRFRLRYLDYDWTLNDTRLATPP